MIELHNINIFHADISLSNIVVNINPLDVRIIDYGKSTWRSQIKNHDKLATLCCAD